MTGTVLAHGGHLHPAAWAAVAVGALVPLVAIVVIVILMERRR